MNSQSELNSIQTNIETAKVPFLALAASLLGLVGFAAALFA
jgi:hypothetical protein